MATITIDDSKINRSAPWHFSRLEPSGTMLAVAPSGQQYVVKRGRMDSEAGHELLNAMVRALSSEATKHEQQAKAEARQDKSADSKVAQTAL